MFAINRSSLHPVLDLDMEKNFLALCSVYGRGRSTALTDIVQFPFMRQLTNAQTFCQNITQLG